MYFTHAELHRRCNNECGLHVHVNRGDLSFTDQQVRDIMSWTWAFEPQMNSVLGQNRFGEEMAPTARETSRYTVKYQRSCGSRSSAIAAVNHFQEDEDAEWVANQAGEYGPDSDLKFNAINFFGTVQPAAGNMNAKPTIEFRQHEGSVDGKIVTHWILTVIGIVDYCCYAPRVDLHNLLAVSKDETWEKLGDGRDEE